MAGRPGRRLGPAGVRRGKQGRGAREGTQLFVAEAARSGDKGVTERPAGSPARPAVKEARGLVP